MKYYIAILCSGILSTSMLYGQTDTVYTHNSEYTQTSSLESEELITLRDQVTEQTIQIKGILDTLCDSIKNSTLETKEVMRLEISLLRDFIQNMVYELPHMSYKNVRNLIKINNQLLETLREQLSTGDLCGLCNLDASLFTTLVKPTRDDAILENLVETMTEINAEVSYLKEQVALVWNMVTSISLAHYTQAATTASHSLSDFIHSNKGYVALAGICATLAFLLRNDSKIDILTGFIERIPVYGLAALYVLRQKKDKDTTALAERWFGKDSCLANKMISLKKWVGSPKEKRPGVHIVARHDMSLEEQLRWADDNDCFVVKVQKARDCDFLKNFIEFEDGLFKLPLAVLFSKQVINDYYALTGRMNGFLQEFFNRLVTRK